MTPASSISQFLEAERARVDAALEQILPPEETYPQSIHRAMRYSVFAGGKRIRPILCIESGRLLGGDEDILAHMASALELIHTYSLIHDDLPALDNDDLRRGKPTCHCAFGEATAILAGDALLTLAFETLSEPGAIPAAAQLQMLHELAHAIGTRAGMVAGQVIDLEMTHQAVDAATLEFIHASKTGALLCSSVRCGAIIAGASDADLDRLTQYGRKIGLAFQIADDLLDITSSSATLGKTAGKDHDQLKATYPALHGIDESRRMATDLIAEACRSLDHYGARAGRLIEIAHFLVDRPA